MYSVDTLFGRTRSPRVQCTYYSAESKWSTFFSQFWLKIQNLHSACVFLKNWHPLLLRDCTVVLGRIGCYNSVIIFSANSQCPTSRNLEFVESSRLRIVASFTIFHKIICCESFARSISHFLPVKWNVIDNLHRLCTTLTANVPTKMLVKKRKSRKSPECKKKKVGRVAGNGCYSQCIVQY